MTEQPTLPPLKSEVPPKLESSPDSTPETANVVSPPLMKPRHRMMMIAIGTFLLMVVTGGAAYYTGFQQGSQQTNSNAVETLPETTPSPDGTQIACTLEAKICPDGSAVGRSGPNCEFAPCPGEAETE